MVRRSEAGTALDEVLVEEQFRQIKVCRMETVCRLRYVDGNERRTRVQNVVPPLRFGEEAVEVTPAYVEQIREAVGNLSDRHNVLVKFIGYTDDTPLSERNERIYMNHVGLSRAQARRVALAVQQELESRDVGRRQRRPRRGAAARLERDGAGPSTESPRRSRVLVRRSAAGAARRAAALPGAGHRDGHARLRSAVGRAAGGRDRERRTRRCRPAWAGLLRRGLADVAGKTNARLRFVGYTRNERLERRTTLVYGDDIGLSAARARRAMEAIAADLQLEPRASRVRRPRLRALRRRRQRGVRARRDVARDRADRLRRGRRARRLRRRRHHGA